MRGYRPPIHYLNAKHGSSGWDSVKMLACAIAASCSILASVASYVSDKAAYPRPARNAAFLPAVPM